MTCNPFCISLDRYYTVNRNLFEFGRLGRQSKATCAQSQQLWEHLTAISHYSSSSFAPPSWPNRKRWIEKPRNAGPCQAPLMLDSTSAIKQLSRVDSIQT